MPSKADVKAWKAQLVAQAEQQILKLTDSGQFKKYLNTLAKFHPKLQEQVSRGVETLPRTACYLMSGSLFSLRVVLNAESGALRSQNTPGGHGSLAFSGEAR
ncbi:hypothetical protein [Lactiplantibacillus plantarum]|uniref:hypothetical protein n=1 Tax=Lactiplantibacillus plantarum TaxID=1590 RepID=UPI0013676D43|nr:hypothetical protein [Lactiplantibacillus plantarum]QHM44980.1 hypothetical protein C7M38_03150 [Lactiplantibacillus plantarum]